MLLLLLHIIYKAQADANLSGQNPSLLEDLFQVTINKK